MAQLSPKGNSLVYSTYIGGPGADGPRTIKVEANGNATVMGVAGASGFPTTSGAYDTTYNGSSQDAAVVPFAEEALKSSVFERPDRPGMPRE